MNFGINTFLFTSPFTTKSISLFPQFKKWGFDSVEIALENASDIDHAQVKAALSDNGLICQSVCAALGSGRDLRGSASDQQNSLDYLKSVMDVMAEMDSAILCGPLYSAVGRAEANTSDEYKRQWHTVVGHLKTLSDYARQLNIVLAIEPLNRYETDFINTCEQGMQMVNDVNSDAIGLLLDTYHMNIEEKDSAKAIIRAGKKLAHFHACGSDRGTPGGDHINWQAIAAALEEVGYDGGAVIESFTTDVKVIAKAASIWRKLEPSQESIAEGGLKFLHSLFRYKDV